MAVARQERATAPPAPVHEPADRNPGQWPKFRKERAPGAPPSGNDVPQRLALQMADDVLHRGQGDTDQGLPGDARDVRGEHHIRGLEQAQRRRGRFGVEDVEPGPREGARLQGVGEGVLVDEGPACGVDDEGGGLEKGEPFGVE